MLLFFANPVTGLWETSYYTCFVLHFQLLIALTDLLRVGYVDYFRYTTTFA